jgi:F-type H+-transporting ATPase subunit b
MAEPAAAAAAGSSGGLPQFDLAQWPGQIVWMLIIFGVMVFLFAKVFVPKVGGTIDAREDRIAGDIGEARRLRDQSEADAKAAEAEMNEARAHAHRTAAEAKAKANAESAKRGAVLEAELAAKLAKAETRIRASRDEAMSHVRAIAGETAGAIVDKLTGVPATADEIA